MGGHLARGISKHQQIVSFVFMFKLLSASKDSLFDLIIQSSLCTYRRNFLRRIKMQIKVHIFLGFCVSSSVFLFAFYGALLQNFNGVHFP